MVLFLQSINLVAVKNTKMIQSFKNLSKIAILYLLPRFLNIGENNYLLIELGL